MKEKISLLFITMMTIALVAVPNVKAEDKSNLNSNIVAAYTYDQTTDSANFCVAGDEAACKKTECYKTKIANSCPSGTIILYKVNSTTIVPFHVMFDEGSTMTMQSQRNTIYNTAWYTEYDNTKGPLTILSKLEEATSNWTNVNNQTYTMGTTVFKTNPYTGCNDAFFDGDYSSCTNTYTLTKTARARMITLQETAVLGCTTSNQSCPIWMYNYLEDSTSYGGTANDTNIVNEKFTNGGYWTMSPNSNNADAVHFAEFKGRIINDSAPVTHSARAVVVVDKPSINDTPSDSEITDNKGNNNDKTDENQDNNNQVVDVDNTAWNISKIGISIGLAILVMGVMVIVQVFIKSKKNQQ